MIGGIVVVGDLLRPDGSGRPGGTDRPTLWLWNAVKRMHALAPLTIRSAWRGAAADTASRASLNDVVVTPDFWRTVLAPHTTVTLADGTRLPPKANRLRIALDSFWNFQQIDADRIPRQAATPSCP